MKTLFCIIASGSQSANNENLIRDYLCEKGGQVVAVVLNELIKKAGILS
jgi:hypothetical protein